MPASTILVATDLSARADRAVDRALQLSEQFARQVRVLHALEPTYDDGERQLDAQSELNRIVGETRAQVKCVVRTGSLSQAIDEAVEASDAALIVLGPARYNSLGDYIMGTAVDYVLRAVEEPVLIVKKRARGPYCDIVAGTDFSDGSAHAIVEAARLFPDAVVHVVHAWHVPFESWQRAPYVEEDTKQGEEQRLGAFMAELAEREPRLAKATSQLVKGSAHEALTMALDEREDSIAVVGSHGMSGFRQAALGSTTSDLLRSLPVDALVVDTRAPERK